MEAAGKTGSSLSIALGKGRAMDRAMGEVGIGVVDFGATSWLDRLLRMSAVGSESSAQRVLPDDMFRNRPAPFVGGLFRITAGPAASRHRRCADGDTGPSGWRDAVR